ncbi:redoxin domain-containing protein [Pontibacter locisalis]|uniref:Redoxin domain-containing protein n=1 Tax=Pontibacter locisalis TaxID=1719035 RepID=A0ABW5IQP8_9BACT
MKKLYILPFSFLLLTGGCAEKKITASNIPFDGFVLKGTAKGFADSTLLYLEDADNSKTNKPLDSAFVINERFELSGKIEEPSQQFILKTKDLSNYRFIWLENKSVSFEGEKGKFRDATVLGSVTENENNELNTLMLSVRRSQDSISNKLEEKGLTKIERAELNGKLQSLYQEEEQRYISFVRNNPASIVSAHLLEVFSSTWGRETTEELFGSFSEANKASKYGALISNYLRLNKDPKMGEQFADFTQETVDGKQVTLSDYKGKVVLLEFWASWCGPCRLENPNLVKTYNNYKDKGFEVVAISLDVKRDNWVKAIEKDGLTWVHVSELNGNKNTAALIYGINGIPDNFLIAKDGTIVGRNLRGEQLNERLAELLN